MSADSSQHRVQQRTDEARAASLAKIENRQVIPERNVLKADVMLLLWILLLISSGTTIGAISTTVLAQFIPGW
jgi:hypothetical protein